MRKIADARNALFCRAKRVSKDGWEKMVKGWFWGIFVCMLAVMILC